MLISRKHVGLLVMAILSGVATAAGIVVAMAVRSTANASTASVDRRSASGSRPSPFGSTASLAAHPDSQIVRPSATAIVSVTGYDANDQPISHGAGYVYSANGIIVTSYSAIRGASSVSIDTSRGEELTVLALMGYSPARDLAALAVLEGNLTALVNGADDIVQEGEAVTALGWNSSTQGVLGVRRAAGGVDLIATTLDAPAGSPVIDGHGKVIGVVSRRGAGAFAVPAHYVSDMLAESHSISFAQMLAETGQAIVSDNR